MKNVAVVLAAGSGSRMNADKNKIFLEAGGRSILEHAVAGLASHPAVDGVITVAAPGEETECELAARRAAGGKHLKTVTGGSERYLSVREGLKVLPDECRYVLIHDGARPFFSRELLSRLLEEVECRGACVPGIPVRDTLKKTGDGCKITDTVSREGLSAVQTPQVFRRRLICSCYELLAAGGGDSVPTDDASVVELCGYSVFVVPGEQGNIKITFPEDLEIMEKNLEKPVVPEIRTGTGFDVHAFAEGRKLFLGGVFFEGETGLAGHSDADVLLHSLADALLGAAGGGDIGEHFPDSDEKWLNVSSVLILEKTMEIVRGKGMRPVNLDITVIAEKPRISSRKEEMKRNIAKICGLEADRINIKGTTTEKLGFTGREEGIAVLSSCLLVSEGEN